MPALQGQRVDSRQRNSVRRRPGRVCRSCGKGLNSYNRKNKCYQCLPLRKADGRTVH